MILAVLLLAASCAGVEELIIQEPEVLETDLRITEISFTGVEMELNLVVSNPNPVGIELAGFDYNLLLAGASFLKGEQTEGVSIEADGTAPVTIPVTLDYETVYRTMASLGDAQETDYRLEAGLRFQLPVIGEKRLAVSREGTIPLVRAPRFSFEKVYVTDLGMMGADVIVLVDSVNPNAFDISLNEFKGLLEVNNQRWSEVNTPESVELLSGKTTEMGFQIRLDFLSMGRTVRDLLSGEKELFYEFTGESVLETSLDFMEEEALSVAITGEIDLLKPDNTTEGRHSSVKIENSIEDNLLNIFGSYR